MRSTNIAPAPRLDQRAGARLHRLWVRIPRSAATGGDRLGLRARDRTRTPASSGARTSCSRSRTWWPSRAGARTRSSWVSSASTSVGASSGVSEPVGELQQPRRHGTPAGRSARRRPSRRRAAAERAWGPLTTRRTRRDRGSPAQRRADWPPTSDDDIFDLMAVERVDHRERVKPLQLSQPHLAQRRSDPD